MISNFKFSTPKAFGANWAAILCLCTLFTLRAAAQPVACKACIQGNFLVVEWCNLEPNSEYYIEWSENAIDWLIESPTLNATGSVELEITEPRLFVRLVEFPQSSTGRADAAASPQHSTESKL